MLRQERPPIKLPKERYDTNAKGGGGGGSHGRDTIRDLIGVETVDGLNELPALTTLLLPLFDDRLEREIVVILHNQINSSKMQLYVYIINSKRNERRRLPCQSY